MLWNCPSYTNVLKYWLTVGFLFCPPHGSENNTRVSIPVRFWFKHSNHNTQLTLHYPSNCPPLTGPSGGRYKTGSPGERACWCRWVRLAYVKPCWWHSQARPTALARREHRRRLLQSLMHRLLCPWYSYLPVTVAVWQLEAKQSKHRDMLMLTSVIIFLILACPSPGACTSTVCVCMHGSRPATQAASQLSLVNIG